MKKIVMSVIAAAVLAGCAMSKEQIEALGPGDKSTCFHARCEGYLCGGPWSTTTNATAATDGRSPRIGERCEVNGPAERVNMGDIKAP